MAWPLCVLGSSPQILVIMCGEVGMGMFGGYLSPGRGTSLILTQIFISGSWSLQMNRAIENLGLGNCNWVSAYLCLLCYKGGKQRGEERRETIFLRLEAT